jgi:glycosyltransferase involved in cell wall biosynthesis
VTQGETGWVFEAGDPGALASALSGALGDVGLAARRDAFRQAVVRRISRFTYAQTTAGLLEALASALPR